MNEENISTLEETPKKSNILIYILVGLILVSSILYMVYRGTKNSNSANPIPTVVEEEKQITLSEISAHNNKESCWTTINGEVFDVTKFINMHKGGDRILNACGVDATDLFTGKSSMGRVHSAMARKILSGMKIGTLQK